MNRIAKVIAGLLAIIALNAVMFFVTAQADANPVPTGAIVFEDGSWRAPNGDTGCIAGQPCED